MSHVCACGCGAELQVRPSPTFGAVWVTIGGQSLLVSPAHVPGLIADLLTASKRVDS